MLESQPCSQKIRQNFSQDFGNRLSQANLDWMEEEDEEEENPIPNTQQMRKELISAGIILPSSQEFTSSQDDQIRSNLTSSYDAVISPHTLLKVHDITDQLSTFKIRPSQEMRELPPLPEECSTQRDDEYFASQTPYDYNYAPLENQHITPMIQVSINPQTNYDVDQEDLPKKRNVQDCRKTTKLAQDENLIKRREKRKNQKRWMIETDFVPEIRKPREPQTQYQRKKKFREMNQNFGSFVSTISPDDLEDGMTMTEIRRKLENYFDIDITNNGIGKLSNFHDYFDRRKKRFGEKFVYIYYKRT